MSPQDLAVIHLTESDDETVCRTQQSIAREISAGRDVVVLCEGQRLLREERLMLARPAIAHGCSERAAETHGRLAIVNTGCLGEEKHLPSHVARAVQFFGSMDSALDWLRPTLENPFASTLHYFAMPAC